MMLRPIRTGEHEAARTRPQLASLIATCAAHQYRIRFRTDVDGDIKHSKDWPDGSARERLTVDVSSMPSAQRGAMQEWLKAIIFWYSWGTTYTLRIHVYRSNEYQRTVKFRNLYLQPQVWQRMEREVIAMAMRHRVIG